VNLTVSTPNITSVSPTSGIAGTQTTIAGTGFGATQGSGNVWLGNTYGIVVSWSDTQVIATVASGSQTGTAQVLQGGVRSNTVSFAVTSLNITNVTPSTASVGARVAIVGSTASTLLWPYLPRSPLFPRHRAQPEPKRRLPDLASALRRVPEACFCAAGQAPSLAGVIRKSSQPSPTARGA